MSFLSKNGWEWVVLLEKWVGVVPFFLTNGWELVAFVKKWMGVGCFS